MTKNDLWAEYVKANPSFDGGRAVTLNPRGLRKLFEQTWDHAYKAGQDSGQIKDAGEAEVPQQLKRMFGL